MKKRIIAVSVIAVMAAILLLSSSQNVMAQPALPLRPESSPAAGSWSWDDEDVTGTVIPQYQLASTVEDDYALLQSAGLHLDGAAQICHPYPGGQFGWMAEIRALTNTGWQSVATLNQWVPDEEGKYMTCANVWSGGTYAVFGYWERPEGWNSTSTYCADLPPVSQDAEWEYVSSAAAFNWGTAEDFVLAFEVSIFGPSELFAGTTGDRCSTVFLGAIETDSLFVNGDPMGASGPAWFMGYSCACDSMYRLEFTPPSGE